MKPTHLIFFAGLALTIFAIGCSTPTKPREKFTNGDAPGIDATNSYYSTNATAGTNGMTMTNSYTTNGMTTTNGN